METDLRRHVSEGLALEEEAACGVDPPPHQVAVRGDAERTGEAPDQVRRRHVEEAPGLGQGHRVEAMLVEEVPKVGGDLALGALDGFDDAIAQVLAEPGADGGEPRLGLEHVVRVPERAVERPELANHLDVLDVRVVDGSPYESFVEHVGPDVEHALAVAGPVRRSPVVHDVRRQDRHPRAGGPVVPRLQVVPDRTLVDDEHGPRVVRVRGIGVVDEPRMEDLVDARHRGFPGPDPFARRGRQQASIVQDPPRSQRLDGSDADPTPRDPFSVNHLLALVVFAFVGSVSPGPNNAVLWASGLRFGFGRTIPHVLGTALGIGVLVVGVAAGIGALLETVPALELVLKLGGSAYLLYVAYLVVGGGAVGRTDVSGPMSLWQAVAFQCVNPKAWIFAVAAVGTFLPARSVRVAGSVLLVGTIVAVVAGSSSIWAAGGAALGSVMDDEGARRVVGVVLAVLLVGSVVLIWV